MCRVQFRASVWPLLATCEPLPEVLDFTAFARSVFTSHSISQLALQTPVRQTGANRAESGWFPAVAVGNHCSVRSTVLTQSDACCLHDVLSAELLDAISAMQPCTLLRTPLNF